MMTHVDPSLNLLTHVLRIFESEIIQISMTHSLCAQPIQSDVIHIHPNLHTMKERKNQRRISFFMSIGVFGVIFFHASLVDNNETR